MKYLKEILEYYKLTKNPISNMRDHRFRLCYAQRNPISRFHKIVDKKIVDKKIVHNKTDHFS